MQQVKNPFNEAITYFNTMPKRNKKIVLVAIGIVGFIALKKVYDIFLRDKIAQQKRNKVLAKGIDAEIIKSKIQGLQATYPDSQYMLLANQIYESMRYAVGDDYGKVVTNMKKMMNNLDVALLIKAFGFRQDYIFGLPEGEPKDLFTFVMSELGNEWGGLTSYRVGMINSNWKSKGIKYQI